MKPFAPFAAAAFAVLALAAPLAAAPAGEGWITLFNGKDLTGWKSNEERPGCFVVEEGVLKVASGRAHLFYTGPEGGAAFRNFEFQAKVKHLANSNSGIYIHTRFQERGWPDHGYECQVNSTTHKDPRKTGGLYAVKDVMNTAPVADGEWFDYHIRVEGKRIVITINGKVTTDWTEPEDWNPAELKMPGRRLGGGTIAIQGHDPGSTVYFKELRLRPLP
jgi:hypothetical protein